MGEFPELLVLGHEVGLAVDSNENPLLVIVAGLRDDQAFGRFAVLSLGRYFLSFLAEQFDGLIEVVLGLFEGLFAIHHSGSGKIPKFTDIVARYGRHCVLS